MGTLAYLKIKRIVNVHIIDMLQDVLYHRPAACCACSACSCCTSRLAGSCTLPFPALASLSACFSAIAASCCCLNCCSIEPADSVRPAVSCSKHNRSEQGTENGPATGPDDGAGTFSVSSRTLFTSEIRSLNASAYRHNNFSNTTQEPQAAPDGCVLCETSGGREARCCGKRRC